MKVHDLGWWLAVLGAINWGLVGLGNMMGSTTNWNVVEMLLGSMTGASNVVYVLVGFAGLWLAWHRLSKSK